MNRTRNSAAVSTTLGADYPFVQNTGGMTQRRLSRHILRIAAALILLPVVAFLLYMLLVNTLWHGVEQGQPAPDFSGQDLQGKVVQLSAFRGRR
jgi:hypothetical protein